VKISQNAKRINTNNTNKTNNFKQILEDIQQRLDCGEQVVVHPEDWGIISKLIEPGVILVPNGKSASGM
jgi:hypothetical protein